MSTSRGRQLRLAENLAAAGVRDERVLDAFRRVPRHEFVEEALATKAYDNCALPLGEKQTISQPIIVAHMLALLMPSPDDRVLEIGTGSGYQTALLSHLVAQVYSMERIASLARTASARLRAAERINVHIKNFDGTYGWRDRAPFQGIVVTAAAPEVPRTLLEQLDDGGRLIIPVGGRHQQVLTRVTRQGKGFQVDEHGACVFVPLIGKFGWPGEEPRCAG